MGVGVRPDGGEVGGQGEEALARRGVDGQLIGGTLTLVFLLRQAEGAQFGVPVGLEGIGDESMGGVHLQVAMLGQVGLVLGPLDLTVAPAVGLGQAVGDLLLDGEGQLHGHRRDRLNEQLADGGIEVGAEQALAGRVAEVATAAEADVAEDQLPAAAGVVVDVHTTAAPPADGASLQERGPLSGRAPRPHPTERLGTVLQSLLEALVFLPRDVSRMSVLDERLPLTARQGFVSGASVG
jgi:hypothetical protein